MTTAFSAEVLRDSAGLQRICDLLPRLIAGSARVSPWQQPEFLSSWWKHIGARRSGEASRQLCLVLVTSHGQPHLAMPLQLSRNRRSGMRWLEPIGMPDDIHRPRLGIGPLDEGAYRCALQAIAALRGEWDGIRLDEKAADDAELHLLQRISAELGWRSRRVPLHACPFLDLSSTWDAYWNGRSAKLRKNLGAARRRLEEQGKLMLQCFESPQDLQRGFEVLLQVTARSWKREAGLGLGSGEAYQAFYREFLGRMAAAGRARIYALFVAGTPVAATLAFLDDPVYYSAQIAHDGAYDAFSPGTLLESMEMQALLTERRFALYDFLGAALSNKRRWTDTMDSTMRILWLARTPRAWAFDAFYFAIKPRLRALRRHR